MKPEYVIDNIEYAKPEDILCAAADYLEKYGWIQRAYGGNSAPACALGALRTVTGYNPLSTGDPKEFEICTKLDQATALLSDSIKRTTAYPKGDIAAWNDIQSRKKDDVINRMREVAGNCDA